MKKIEAARKPVATPMKYGYIVYPDNTVYSIEEKKMMGDGTKILNRFKIPLKRKHPLGISTDSAELRKIRGKRFLIFAQPSKKGRG